MHKIWYNCLIIKHYIKKDNILMRELLSKKSHRQLELLELLFKNKRWFHISELAELLNCTERSVKDDLSHVKSAFPELIFTRLLMAYVSLIPMIVILRWSITIF